MNAPPFDIDEFRAQIGDDREIEKKLFELFLESADESFALLEAGFSDSPDDEYNKTWKSHLHQIKGAALNLGANHLSDLSAKAMKMVDDNPDDRKIALYQAIDEFKNVKSYIGSL